MRKLHLIASGVAFATFSVTATAAPEFYLGAQVGYQSNDVENGAEYFSGNISGAEFYDTSVDGIAGGIFAGARFDFHNGFFIAPEINLNTSAADGGDTEVDSTGYDKKYEIEAGKSYGISLLLGKELITNTTFYGRLGYQRTDFETTRRVVGESNETLLDDTFSGIRYGFGMETNIAEQLALRIDWSQTQYSEEKASFETYDLILEPTENLLQVGLSYRF